MSAIDWSRFTTRINVKAQPKKIFESWTTPGGLESWFLRAADFQTPGGKSRNKNDRVEKGDTYSWRWFGYSDDVTETGEILQLEPGKLIKFSFGKAGICSVTLIEHGEEQVVELIQEQIPVDEKSRINYHVGCKTGWTFYLANLKSILEGGIDLRNKNENLTEMLNS